MAPPDRTPSTVGIALGTVLVLLGGGAYVASDFASATALIPAIFGVVIVGLGVVGRQTDRTAIATYGIGALAALGVLGSLRGVPDVIALLTGGDVDSTVAAVSMGTMIVVCLALVGVVVRSVLENR